MTNDFEIIPPNPASLIQSMRAFGYNLSTAIADILDNSISASAKNIWIDFFWSGENSYISIIDDGSGMTVDELINAMRLGSISPSQKRVAGDLGRFGLGLKTASFSQCKKLTVLTRKNNNISARCWDLDFVVESGQWNLLKTISDCATVIQNKINKLETGTAVILEQLDRITSGTNVDNAKDKERFFDEADDVKKHLAMVFHRFLERPNGIKIWINDKEIKPWNPFLPKETATQNLTEETHHIFGDKLVVKPYVLPHISKITSDIYDYAAGPNGWNAQQGFYVYRNSRMLVYGDWLGLGFQKEEHCKLARILLDIPNSMDEQWDLDVKKSRAFPPYSIRNDLKRIAQLTRQRAVEIYRHRGKIIARENNSGLAFMWERKFKDKKIRYTINRNHPLVKELLDNPDLKENISHLLRLLEETLPIPTIIIDSKDYPIANKEPFEDIPTKEIINIANKLFEILLKNGYSVNQAKQSLILMEPFNLYSGLIDELEKGVNKHV